MLDRGSFDLGRNATGRRAVLAVLVLGQFVSGVGFIAPTRARKDASRPFPCMSRPCGCLTYEQCWAGDCCCFTLAEKLVWAETNRVVPPAHARRILAADKKPSCCKPTVKPSGCPHCPAAEPCLYDDAVKSDPGDLSARWIDGLSALRCKGHSFAGVWVAGPALPPEAPLAWAFEWVSAGVLVLTDAVAVALPSRPTDPPPRW